MSDNTTSNILRRLQEIAEDIARADEAKAEPPRSVAAAESGLDCTAGAGPEGTFAGGLLIEAGHPLHAGAARMVSVSGHAHGKTARIEALTLERARELVAADERRQAERRLAEALSAFTTAYTDFVIAPSARTRHDLNKTATAYNTAFRAVHGEAKPAS